MKRGKKIIGPAIIVACVAIAAISLSGAATPHVSFAQARESRESCQIYGKLLKDSVRMGGAMTQVRFVLEDKTTGERIPCYYNNASEPVPANFVTATEVRALGTWSPKAGEAGENGAFVVTQMQTKCPSKYDSGQYEAPKSGLPALGEPGKPAAPAPAVPAPVAPNPGRN